MTDVFTPEKRSAVMRRVKGRATSPELKVRKALTALGVRYRLNRKDLPGSPDIVLGPRRLAIFVHGCFWHGHENCKYFRLPATRPEFWLNKIMHSKQRDKECISQLLAENYRVAIFWECSLRSLPPHMFNFMLSGFDAWIHDASSDRIEFSSSTVS